MGEVWVLVNKYLFNFIVIEYIPAKKPLKHFMIKIIAFANEKIFKVPFKFKKKCST